MQFCYSWMFVREKKSELQKQLRSCTRPYFHEKLQSMRFINLRETYSKTLFTLSQIWSSCYCFLCKNMYQKSVQINHWILCCNMWNIYWYGFIFYCAIRYPKLGNIRHDAANINITISFTLLNCDVRQTCCRFFRFQWSISLEVFPVFWKILVTSNLLEQYFAPLQKATTTATTKGV